MAHKLDIAVIGGGVVGLTAALAMAVRGYRIGLFDAGDFNAKTNYPDARVYAINLASAALFDSLGVWSLIPKERAAPYRHMSVWDASSNIAIDFDACDIAHDRLGNMLEEGVLKAALLERIKTYDNVILYPFIRIDAVVEAPNQIHLNAGVATWQASLLLVADGAQSAVRDLLGVTLTSWPYHHQAIVTAVSCQKPHQETAYQVFHAEGPLAFLPMSSKHDCSIVWSVSPDKAAYLMALSDKAFEQALSDAFSQRLGEVTLLNKRSEYPLRMRHTKQYVGARWLLMGDAAHTIHPLAGLGLNLGLADIATWLDCQDKAQQPPWSTRVLQSYQRQRRHGVWQMIALMDTLKAVFSNTYPLVKQIRRLGMQCFNRLGPLKRLCIQYATGKSLGR